MIAITINNSQLTFKGQTLNIKGSEQIDTGSFMIHTDGGSFNFLYNDTEVNGSAISDIYSLVPKMSISPPNWNGLTQALWGSSLMGYAYAVANSKGFALLLKVLSDGEAGSAAESSFITALNLCQLNLSTDQKTELNQLLTANNFTIQVP